MIDTLGVVDAHRALPERVRSAMALAAASELGREPDDVDRVVIVAGVHAEGIADAVVGRATECTGRAVVTPSAPQWLTERDVMLAVGLSPSDDEPMEVLRAGRESGAAVVVVGDHPPVRPGDEVVSVPVPSVDPTPRGAVPPMLAAAAVVAARLGVIDDIEPEPVVTQLVARRADPRWDEVVHRAVARIGMTFPLVHGAGWIGGVAADYLAALVNADVKTPAFGVDLDTVLDGAAAGWGLHGDVTRQVFSAVVLRHGFEAPGVTDTWSEYEEVLIEVTDDVIEFDAAGEGWLTQLIDLMSVGQSIALAMADRAGIDPGPAPAID